MAFWTKQKEDSQTFSDLIRGLQHSVNAAMEMLEARNLELLGRYFTEEGHPRLRRLNLDDHTAVDVPIISIVNPSALNIKEVEMDFAVQINGVELYGKMPQRGFLVEDDKVEDLNLSIARSNLEISFTGAPDQSTMKVKIKFESAPVPEGLARVIEEYDKTIMPFNKEEVE
jgi:hypothetical protein